MFSTLYHGLMRIGEVTESVHVLKVSDVHVSKRNDHILIMLYSSKTHTRADRPQRIRINAKHKVKSNHFRQTLNHFCPVELIVNCSNIRKKYKSKNEPFFIFKGGEAVQTCNIRAILKKLLKQLRLNPKNYDTHSFRIGCATDMLKSGESVETIKYKGRWRSNTVYKYLREI